MDYQDYELKVKKFILDDENQKAEYLEIMNDPDCIITDSKFTFDKMKNNQAIICIWWKQPKDE